MAFQLDLFSLFTAPVGTKPASKPVPQMTVTATPTKPYTIDKTPERGYRVVLAPGLTTSAPKNPCLTCQQHRSGQSKEDCSENCLLQHAREAYLDHIGIPLVSAVESDGVYGVSC